MSARALRIVWQWVILCVCVTGSLDISRAQNTGALRLIPGSNVNMVSGMTWPDGDPFLQRQNEPSIAVSTRNAMHILAGANDYRTVDIPGLPTGMETGDSWLGVFRSNDGGDSWRSTLLSGYPQESSSSSPLYGYRAAADPVMRAGTNGMFYFSGIAFDRGFNPKSTVFVARFIDLNNEEGGDPIKYLGTVKVGEETGGAFFIDKPWMAVDIPRSGAQAASISIAGPNNTTIFQNFACGNVYVAWAEIVGDGIGMESRIMFSRSADCGATFSTPIQLSADNTLNQGATIAVAPDTGNVYVSWRQFPLPKASGCMPTAFQKFVARGGQGYWKNHPEKWPAQDLTIGGFSYPKTFLIDMLKTPVKGDATYTLFYQLIAAKLNYLVYPDGAILPKINEADAWLGAHPLGSVPKDKAPGLDLSDTLQQYNEGPSPLACDPLDAANKIMATRSTNSGVSFGAAAAVSTIAAFDQGTSNISFRSTAYPSMTVDGGGRVYLAWATRGMATTTANSDPVAGDSRIVITSSPGDAAWPAWTAPQPIDQPNVPGHQIKPALCFTAGKLYMLYYDFRQDVSGDFQQYIADLATLPARRTVDVRAALADPGPTPVFTDYSVLNWRPSDQMSRYAFLILANEDPGDPSLINTQLQFNPPNLPLFVGGTAPFHGDYLDIAPSPAFVVDADGNWAFNTAASNGSTLQATWTDNRDVTGPPDGDWTKYVPPTHANSGGTSIFDPLQTVPACQTGTLDEQRTGMRNQNIYNARVSRGLYVASPGSYKPLGEVQRAFVVYVQNSTAVNEAFRLQIAPNGVTASFTQSGIPLLFLDVEITAYSSVARTVFVNGQGAQAPVRINVFEIDGVGGQQVTGGLESSVILNPDPTNPAPADPSLMTAEIHTPAIMNPAIMNPAIMNPAIMNPAIMNPAIMNPAIMNPAIMNPAIMNPAIMNPAIMNPAIMNPAIMNPAIMNPAIMNPAIMNPAIMNSTLKEVNWQVQNEGNTTTGYTFNALLPNPPAGLVYQLLIYRLYMTPVADGCTLKQEAQQELLVNVINPELSGSLFRNGQLSSDPKQPTFFLNPGDYALVTLVAYPDPGATSDPAQILANLSNFHPEDVSAGIVAEPADSNAPPGGPAFPAAATMKSPSIPPLFILTGPGSIPGGGVVGSPYSFTLSVTGGLGSYGWTMAAGTLPPGLTLMSNGTISGIPTTAGTFNFTIQANDFVQTTTQSYSISISLVSSLTFLTQPRLATAGQNTPPFDVQALDGSGDGIPGVTVTLSIGTIGCTGSSLSGNTTITDGDGVAHFSTLRMDRGGLGYTLVAAAGSPPVTASSAQFDTIGFCETGSMAVNRSWLTSTLLPNGKVLVTGGQCYTMAAELYDPVTNSFGPTNGLMNAMRAGHTATLLSNSKVLLVGGGGDCAVTPLATAELFDPDTGTFSLVGSMAYPRKFHTVTLLPDGKVLIAGGETTGNVLISSVELYDPADGSFRATGGLTVPRAGHTATLLPSGRVLVAGGVGLDTAEIYDPATGSFAPVSGRMSNTRHFQSATLLPDGKILLAGGGDSVLNTATNTVDIYDPVTDALTSVPPMNRRRLDHRATLLANGKVLISGGWDADLSSPTASSEIYDAVSGTSSLTGLMTAPRRSHSSVLLPDGRVLVTGWGMSADLFYPDKTQIHIAPQPGNATAGVVMKPIQVRAVDGSGKAISGVAVSIGIVPHSCPACTLSGTMPIITDTNGYATFSDLIVDKGGQGYRLFASSPALGVMTASAPFHIAGFCATGSLNIARYQAAAAVLPNGNVLVAGGLGPINFLSSTELYNSSNGSWTATGDLAAARWWHTATSLANGKVLVVGGQGNSGAMVAAAELYDAVGGWTGAGFLATARGEHGATLLANGDVLISGGSQTGGAVLASAEIFAASSGSWSTTGSMATTRRHHSTTLLPNGKVLVTGGEQATSVYLSSAEIFDPAIGTWSSASSLGAARSHHSATLLPNGKVLVAGGWGNTGPLSSVELYDPPTNSWNNVAPLHFAREYHSATLLPSGKVLVVGGYGPGTLPQPAELFDPSANTWSITGSLITGRRAHSNVLLSSGEVLVVGGWNWGPLATTELFYPDRTQLTFTIQPSDATAGSRVATVKIHAVDNNGNPISGKAINIGIVRASCPACTLSGTMPISTDAAGDAAFSDLIANRGGWEYRLFASAPELGVMSASDQFSVAGFCETGSLGAVRYRGTMTLLPNGKVLAAAGEDGSNVLKTAELYDPASGAWSSTGSLNVERFSHQAVLLPNGKVLVEGGNGTMTGGIQSTAELYDPGPGTWGFTGSLNADRTEHTATLLSDGRVLVVGGHGNPPADVLSSAEIYDPALGTWSFTGSLHAARYGHTATLLQDGKVLVAGGFWGVGIRDSAEIYDPSTGAWSYTAVDLTGGRGYHTATLLNDGRVLVTGGEGGTGTLSSAEIYDPATTAWSFTAGSLNDSRSGHTATLMPNGTVLLAGGNSEGSVLSGAELYDPVSSTFSRAGPMVNPRSLHSAVLLPDGKVLQAGGSPTVTELYYPACARYPSGYVPFAGIYYVSGPNGNGDRLLVGTMTMASWWTLNSVIPLPSYTNQCFCGLVELAPGQVGIAYVPTALERMGDFGSFTGLLIDPVTGLPFPAGIIPASRIPDPFAWKIRIIIP